MADPFGYLMNSFQTPQYGNTGYGVVSPGMQYLWELQIPTSTDNRTDVWSRDFMIWKINFELWAVGCVIKVSGPIMSNFWGPFFHFFRVKNFFFNFFENTIASALKSYIIPFLQFFFKFFENTIASALKSCIEKR